MVRTNTGEYRGRWTLACGAILAVLALAACSQENAKSGADGRPAPETGAPAEQIKAEDLGPAANAETQALYTGEFEAAANTEPFWRLDLLNDYASFSRPGLSEAGGMPSQRDYRANGARIIAGPLTIVLKAQNCVHDSGETYPYQAIVQFEGVSYEGCARRGGATSESATDWTSNITRLMPAIDACLKKIEKKPARVTIAYVNDDQASVRLLDAEGGRYECGIPLAGGDTTYWESIGDRDVLQGEREPMFIRAPGPAPQGACLAVTPAKDANGVNLGWYVRRSC